MASWGIIATFQQILQSFVEGSTGVMVRKLQAVTLNFLVTMSACLFSGPYDRSISQQYSLAFCSVLNTDWPSGHIQGNMVPFIPALYSLSLSPEVGGDARGQGSSLERQSWPPNIYSVLSANWLPGEENIFGSNHSTQQARDLKKRQGRGGSHVIPETNKRNQLCWKQTEKTQWEDADSFCQERKPKENSF